MLGEDVLRRLTRSQSFGLRRSRWTSGGAGINSIVRKSQLGQGEKADMSEGTLLGGSGVCERSEPDEIKDAKAIQGLLSSCSQVALEHSVE